MRGCKLAVTPTDYFVSYVEDANSDIDWGDTVAFDNTVPSLVGQRTHLAYAYPSDASQTLTRQQSRARVIEVAAGGITAARDLVLSLPPEKGREFDLVNRQATYAINVYASSGAGLVVPAGKTARIGGTGSKLTCISLVDNAASEVSRDAIADPTDLPNLLAWYRMDLGATTSGGGTVLDALADQSGNSRNLASTGSAITYTASDAAYGNQATATFAGAQKLDGAAWGSSQSQPYTIYWVGHSASHATRIFSSGPVCFNVSGEWGMYAGTNIIAATGTDATAPSVGCIVFNGASSAMYIGNAGTAAATGNPGSDAMPELVLGADIAGGGDLYGKIAEVFAYSGTHDAATRSRVMAYLTARYL
jgi:hypothetical protein